MRRCQSAHRSRWHSGWAETAAQFPAQQQQRWPTTSETESPASTLGELEPKALPREQIVVPCGCHRPMSSDSCPEDNPETAAAILHAVECLLDSGTSKN